MTPQMFYAVERILQALLAEQRRTNALIEKLLTIAEVKPPAITVSQPEPVENPPEVPSEVIPRLPNKFSKRGR